MTRWLRYLWDIKKRLRSRFFMSFIYPFQPGLVTSKNNKSLRAQRRNPFQNHRHPLAWPGDLTLQREITASSAIMTIWVSLLSLRCKTLGLPRHSLPRNDIGFSLSSCLRGECLYVWIAASLRSTQWQTISTRPGCPAALQSNVSAGHVLRPYNTMWAQDHF